MNIEAALMVGSIHAYHHNNSLLFQFILVEFIEAFELIRSLEQLCNRQSSALIPHTINELNSESTLSSVETILVKLVGAKHNHVRLINWNQGNSTIVKIKIYCSLFIDNSNNDEKEIMTMQYYADKIWTTSLKIMDLLEEETITIPQLLPLLDKINLAIHRFSKLITRLIHQFRDDENVIFSILRHKDRLDRIYGGQYVAKQLSRLYPKGLNEVQKKLTERYSVRGFNNIIPDIAAKIAEVKNSLIN